MSDFNNDQNQEVYEQNTTYVQAEVPDADIEKKGFAIASLVLGIVSLVGCCCFYLAVPMSILAIVFAIIVFKANKDNGRTKGKGLATAGLILGIIGVLLSGGYGIFSIVLWVTGGSAGSMDQFNEIINSY